MLFSVLSCSYVSFSFVKRCPCRYPRLPFDFLGQSIPARFKESVTSSVSCETHCQYPSLPSCSLLAGDLSTNGSAIAGWGLHRVVCEYRGFGVYVYMFIAHHMSLVTSSSTFCCMLCQLHRGVLSNANKKETQGVIQERHNMEEESSGTYLHIF